MSTTIDQRVVEMRFDNRQFEQNVSSTMSLVDKLKNSLNLTGAAKGLNDVGTAARNINLSGLTSAAETVGVKFSYMQATIQHQLNNIVDNAVSAGKRIASALTIDPIKTGFAEYETQINAVQTILANTESKGTTITDVNKALDTLNQYADKTIYNFTEMTRNIGTFTAAGVDLDTSVKSIQGIANLAAVSGSTSQQASNAMYQLSQALAAGKVSLMDWNSVVNAGMGGEVFQNALKRTAKANGTDVDKLIKKYGSFRESLTQGEWLTTDVLTETLEQFTMAAEEGSEEWKKFKKSLMSDGYTEKQAEEILKMANTATNAATKVKTFTQLWDTLKEAAQSGWTQTWEIIVGDFEEAKETLTKVSDVIGDIINNSAKARNELLQGWKDAGGRDDLLDGFANIFNGLKAVIVPIKKAFSDIFSPTTVDQAVDQLVSFTEGFKNLTQKFEEFTTKHGDQIYSTFKGIFSVLDIGWTIIKDLAGGFVGILGNFTGFGGTILDVTGSIGDYLSNIRDAIEKTDIFGLAIDKVVGFVGETVDSIKTLGSSMKETFMSKHYDGFLSFFEGLWDVLQWIGGKVTDIFGGITDGIAKAFGENSFADVLNSGLVAGILAAILKFSGSLSKPFEALTGIFEAIGDEDGILGNITGILDDVRGCFEAYQNQLQAETIKKIAIAIGILAAAIFVLSTIDGESLDHSLGAITVMFIELIAALAVFTKIKSGFKTIATTAIALNGIAMALLILSAAMKVMSTISMDEMEVALTGLTIGLAALAGAVWLLPEKKVTKAAKAMGKMSMALLILSAAMKIMGSLSWDEMDRALTGVAVGLVALVAAINLLPKDMALRTLGMIGLATSMTILGGAMHIMASLNWNELAVGLAGMAGALTAVTLAVRLLPKDAALRSAGMIGLATAVVILGAALKSMGSMSTDEIVNGCGAMSYALMTLCAALYFMKGSLAGSAALIVAAGALAIIAPVLKILGGMSIEEIGKGLLAIGGALAIFSVAAAVVTPLIPSLLALAGAFALFGIATLGIGAGLLAISAGFTALAVAGTAGATALVASLSVIILGIVDLIPELIERFGGIITSLCDVLIEAAPKIADTLLVILTEVTASLARYTPQIVDSLMKFVIGVLDAFAANLPQLIVSAVNVISAFFQGVVDALSGLDTSSLIKGIAGVGLLAGLMMVLSSVVGLIPGAMVGVLGMGVVIAELALVLAAIGALAQIPGLSWLIEKGGDFLQTIGVAIGKFVGGIVGGIAEGATSTLPQIGTSLSEFMTNLQPFLDGAKRIDATMMEGVKALAETILLLTGANILDGLSRFIPGAGSLSSFGAELGTLGTNLNTFATNLGTFDESKVNTVTCAANAIKTLAEASNSIPNEGGWAAKIFGDNGLASFGAQLPALATNLNAFATNLGTFDDAKVATVTCAANAIKAFANAAQGIDGQSEWAKKIFGDNSLSTFSSQFGTLGTNLAAFATNLGTFTDAQVSTIKSAISAIKALSGLADADLEGAKKNLGGFGSKLAEFGSDIADFISDMPSVEAITAAVDGLKKIISTIDDISNANSGALADFSDNLKKLGDGAVDKFISAFDSAVARTDVKNAAKKLADQVVDGIESKEPAIERASKALASTGVTAVRDKYQSFYSAGSYLVSGFCAGISENDYKAEAKARAMAKAAAEAAEDALDINSPSKVFRRIGTAVPEGFAQGISKRVDWVKSAVGGMSDTAIGGVKTSIARISDAISGNVDTQPTIRPVLDLSDIRNGASAINGLLGVGSSTGIMASVGAISRGMNARSQNGSNSEVVSAINKLRKDLGNVGGTSYTINGLSYSGESDLDEAFKTIVRHAKIERRV